MTRERRRAGRSPAADERGASIAITHVLTLAISGILITGLVVTAGSVLEGQQQTVARQQLEDLGADLVEQLGTADRLASDGEWTRLSATSTYPETVAGKPYRFALVPEGGPTGTQATLYVRSPALDRPITLDVGTRWPMVRSNATEEPTVSVCPAGTAGPRRLRLGACA